MKEDIFNIKSEAEFTTAAMNVFKHQFKNNRLYRSFCDLLYKHPSDVKKIEEIPFLPIQFFKSRNVLSSLNDVEEVFTSSGTTQATTSKHFVTDISYYKESFTKGFETFYGDVTEYTILALLPNYLERQGSSLVFMVDELIRKSHHLESNFYLNNLDELAEQL
jgi:hypothetical protein